MRVRGHHRRRRRHPCSTTRGFSLVEVLIAVLVLSVGILGVAALQVTTKRSNFEAVQRSSAAVLVHDLIERMRANADELASYTNNGAGLTLDGGTIGAATDCAVSSCNAAQLAQFDLFEWEQALAGVTEQVGGNNSGGLVTPTACITGPNGGSGTYTIALAWRGLSKLSNPTLNACGQGTGRYDSATENDVYRRLILLETFISEPV